MGIPEHYKRERKWGMRMSKHFRLWFERHWLQVGHIPYGWYGIFRRTAWNAYLKGRKDERKLRNKILASMMRRMDALEAEIKQNYIDEIITDTYSGSDKLLDSACNNSSAIGLRKLAEWGIVTIEEDYGRRVIARLNEG